MEPLGGTSHARIGGGDNAARNESYGPAKIRWLD